MIILCFFPFSNNVSCIRVEDHSKMSKFSNQHWFTNNIFDNNCVKKVYDSNRNWKVFPLYKRTYITQFRRINEKTLCFQELPRRAWTRRCFQSSGYLYKYPEYWKNPSGNKERFESLRCYMTQYFCCTNSICNKELNIDPRLRFR